MCALGGRRAEVADTSRRQRLLGKSLFTLCAKHRSPQKRVSLHWQSVGWIVCGENGKLPRLRGWLLGFSFQRGGSCAFSRRATPAELNFLLRLFSSKTETQRRRRWSLTLRGVRSPPSVLLGFRVGGGVPCFSVRRL